MFRFARKIKTRLQMCHHICLFCKWKHQCRQEQKYIENDILAEKEAYKQITLFKD